MNQSALAVPVQAWTLDTVSNFRNGSWSFGDLFTVGSNNITVTELGAFDANKDGFVTQGGIHVGIFRESDDTLLVDAHVTSGDTLIGNYRFVDTPDLTLLANTQYRVVAVNEDDLYNITSGTPNNVNPSITWDSYGYCNTTTLTSCDDFTGIERSWMANFLLDDNVNVSEPGIIVLMGLGMAGLLGFRRRQ